MIRILAPTFYLIGCALFLRHFWLAWTPHCNEACPAGIVIGIYATFAVVVAATLMIAIATLKGRLSPRASLLGYLCLCVIALSASYGISHAVQSSGAAS